MNGIKSLLVLFALMSVSLIRAIERRAMFTIIDDDASNVASIESIHRVAEKHGINVCFGVIADRIRCDTAVTDLLLRYQDEGHQIINHSLTHGAKVWKNPDVAGVEYELLRSSEILDSLGFRNHDYLVYPWGRFTEDVWQWMLPLVAGNFKLAFDSRGYGCDLDYYNRYCMPRFPLRKHDNFSVVCYEIGKTAKKSGWFVILTHSAMARDFSEEYLNQVVARCLESGMECVTVGEAYATLMVRNQLKEDRVGCWTKTDETCYLIYMHLWWCMAFVVVGLVFLFAIVLYCSGSIALCRGCRKVPGKSNRR